MTADSHQLAALPVVSCQEAKVVEMTNPAGQRMFFTVERWECCLRLTSIDTRRSWKAVLMSTAKPGYGFAFAEIFGETAFDSVFKRSEPEKYLLMQATVDLLGWLGLLKHPNAETPAAAT